MRWRGAQFATQRWAKWLMKKEVAAARARRHIYTALFVASEAFFAVGCHRKHSLCRASPTRNRLGRRSSFKESGFHIGKKPPPLLHKRPEWTIRRSLRDSNSALPEFLVKSARRSPESAILLLRHIPTFRDPNKSARGLPSSSSKCEKKSPQEGALAKLIYGPFLSRASPIKHDSIFVSPKFSRRLAFLSQSPYLDMFIFLYNKLFLTKRFYTALKGAIKIKAREERTIFVSTAELYEVEIAQ